jgi:heavy metal translocating P-type ATPase
MESGSAIQPNRAQHSAVTELSVSGMTCGNCARHVTEAIQSVPGVHSATVNLGSHSASVRWDAKSPRHPAAVIEAIEKEGYRAKVVEAPAHDAAHHALAGWHTNLIIAVVATVPLMIGEWVFQLAMVPWFQWFSFALATIVQVFAGAQFYRGAWNQLKIRSSNMDTLVALGSTTAYGFSVWALFTGYKTHLYFMEAASIIALISVGHWVESHVTVRASDALKKLLNLAPPTARRLSGAAIAPVRNEIQNHPKRRIEAPSTSLSDSAIKLPSLPGGDGRREGEGTVTASFASKSAAVPGKSQILSSGFLQNLRNPATPFEEEVPVSALKIGDLIVLRPGDAVPTDGKVVEGNSAVDEAMLTGESAPIDKAAGSDLFAGTINLNSRLVTRVTAMGDETALAHIIASVQRAQTSRANIQRLGDRVSGVFVPIVVAIALAAGLWWGLNPASATHAHQWLGQFLWHAHPPDATAAGFIIAAAVLIIACPCAMGLATPAAIMAGSNAAARRGILVRDGVALEKAGMITAVVLDKTGTLTTGELAMVGPWTADGSDASRELAQELAGSLSAPSNHPVSKVLKWLARNPIALQNWRDIPGSGVQAELNSEIIRLGSVSWMNTFGIDIPENAKLIEKWKNDGATIIALAKGNALLGTFGLRDFLKPNAAEVVSRLQRQGLKTFLLTGDNSRTALVIAKEVGIQPEQVFAEVRPEQKSEFVKKLQAAGERVAFVGDGINDAPALEQADLGVAVSRASDVAREAADIILLKSDIEAVPEALGLARATLRTIKQNLFWAFFYNCIGIPLAALGFMSPILCAAAMGFSDLIVIGNALRLRSWMPRRD